MIDRPAINGTVVVLALFFFFPVGIVLFGIRVWKHRNLSYQKIYDWAVAGTAFLIMYSIMCLIFTDEANRKLDIFIFISILFLLPGLLLLWVSGRKRKRLYQRYEQYRNIVMNQGVTSIYGISERVFQRPMVVAYDLQRMVYLKMLPNAVIDTDSMRIIFDQGRSAASTIHVNVAVSGDGSVGDRLNRGFDGKSERSNPQPSFAKAEKPLPKTVECSGCGSSTLLRPGQSTTCAYCDSPLSYPKSG